MPDAPAGAYGDRIHPTIEHLAHPVDQLQRYAKNPRRGDVTAIAESLRANGQYRPIVARVGTNEVLAGNHTLQGAKLRGWSHLAVTWVDVTDDAAARIVLIDNRVNDLAAYDDTALLEVLTDLPNLTGTGYSDTDMADLFERVESSRDAGDALDDALDQPATRGDLLALVGATVGEPDYLPETGQVWRVGQHRLVIGDVHTDWPTWAPLLQAAPNALFWPYPSLLAPFAKEATTRPAVMVQPNRYLAGWLLTKWHRLTGHAPVIETAAR